MIDDIQFVHEITTEYLALPDGVQFESLEPIGAHDARARIQYTRLSSLMATVVCNFIKSYCDQFNIQKICRSCTGTHGIFNVFNSTQVTDFYCQIEKSELNQSNILFCGDFNEWQALDAFKKDVKSFLSNIGDNDFVLIAVDKNRLNVYKDRFNETLENEGFYIHQIFFIFPTEKLPLLSPENEEISDWNHLSDYKDGIYFINLRKGESSSVFVKMIDGDTSFVDFFSDTDCYIEDASIKDGLFFNRLQFLGYPDYENTRLYESNRLEARNWLQERTGKLAEYDECPFSSLLNLDSVGDEATSDAANTHSLFFSWGNVWKDENELNIHRRKISNFAFDRFHKHNADSINKVIFNSNFASATYFYHFFKSTFGSRYLHLFPFSFWKDGGKLEDYSFHLPVPSIKIQLEIVSSIEKLEKVKASLSELSFDGLLDPVSTNDIATKINSLGEVAGSLSDAEAVMSMIERRESKTLEFKETLSWSIRENKKAGYIQDEVVGTITAFLNTPGGGTLLIGVNDRGELAGIEAEIKNLASNYDKYLLTLNNLIASRVGKEFFSYVDWKLVSIGGKSVVYVSCRKSPRPVWAGQERLFVRTNPATHQLSGPALLVYIKENFPDN